MPDLLEGAEKSGATAPVGVSPTPNPAGTTPAQTQAGSTPAPQSTAPQQAAQAPGVGTPAAEVPTPENGDEGQPAEGEGASEGDKREKFIPRERFDEVHQKAQQAEADREAARRELTETREAASLGFRDVAQYKAVTEEAKQFGFADAGAYLAALQQQQQTQAEISQINERGDLTDDVKADLVAAKQINLQAQQQLMQSQALTQQMQRQALETTLSEACRDLGLPELPADMEKIFRQTSPEVIRNMVASIKPLLKQQAQTEVARYAAAKDGDRATPAPEGRGGTPPPASAGKQDWRKMNFATLLHGGRKD